jgi:hypothetical protein
MASSFLFHKGLNGREHEVGLPTINNSTTRDSLNPVGSDVCNVVTGSSSFVSATFILRYRMHPLAFGLGRQNKKKAEWLPSERSIAPSRQNLNGA